MTIGLVSLLNTGKSSLVSHQTGIATASQNLANVNTGLLEARPMFIADARYSGLANVDIRRRSALFVGVNILNQEARKGAAEANHGARQPRPRLRRRRRLPRDRLDRFFDAIRTLETSPTDGDLRSNLVAQAQGLVDKINQTAKELDTQRLQADQTIEDTLARVNAITQNIASLNEQISEVNGAGQNAYEAMDQRDNLIRELSGMLDVSTFVADDGQVTVLFNGAQPLVEGK